MGFCTAIESAQAKLWQCPLHNVRKCLLRLFARAWHPITVRGAQPFAEHFRGGIIRQFRQLRGGIGYRPGFPIAAEHRHGAD